MIVKDIMNKIITSLGASLFLFTTMVVNAQILEEIVVTAQKREQSLQDVAISITAFSGKQISALGYTNTIDISQQTPSLMIKQIHPSITNVTIRGVSQNDFGGHLEAPVAMYVDNAYVSSMGAAHVQMFDLERVEVLRGPQGTLFGRNATGGLLHFMSHRPTDTFEGYGEFTYAEYDQIKFEGAVSGPLSENILGRLSIATNKHDGVAENRIGPDLRSAETYSARGQLVFNINEDLELYLKAAYSVDDTLGNSYVHTASAYDAAGLGNPVGPNEVATFVGIADFLDATQHDPITGPCAGCDPFGYVEPDDDPHTGSYDFIGEFRREIYNLQGKITWEADGFTVTSITDFFKMNKDNGEDIDGGPNEITFEEEEDREQISQELRFNGETERARWIAGFYYLDFDVDSYGFVVEDIGPLTTFGFDSSTGAIAPAFNDPSMPCFAPPFSGPCPPGLPGLNPPFFHRERVESTSWAIFGHLEYDITEQITLIGALRYTEDDRSIDLVIDNTAFGAPLVTLNPGNTPAMEQGFNNVSAKAQINWKPTEDLMLYAGFTRGHKAGNFSAPFFIPASLTQIPHDEEVLHSYEIGAKATLLDGLARLNASAFYYDYTDYQASFFINFAQQLSNLDAEVYGAEVELTLNPSDSLEFLFGLSLLDTKVKNVGMPDGSLQDRKLPGAPPFSFNGLGRYNWSAFNGNLAIQGDFKYVDDYCYGVICHPVEEAESYVVANARISYATQDEKWEVSAFVRNLSDTEYQMYGADASFAGIGATVAGMPRWFGGSVSYHF